MSNDRKVVTEFDFRMPEFRQMNIKPEDYEFRGDGKVVRKDRWEWGVRNIATIMGCTHDWEIDDVVAAVRAMQEKMAPPEEDEDEDE